MIVQLMKLGTSVIPHFHVILTGQSISKNILFIFSMSLSSSKNQFLGQVREYIIFNK